MNQETTSPGILMKSACGLILLAAAMVCYTKASQMLAQGYVLSWVGNSRGSRFPAAAIGVHGWMLVVASPLIPTTFALLGLRKLRLTLMSFGLCCALFMMSTAGTVRCANYGDSLPIECNVHSGPPPREEGFTPLRMISAFIALLGVGAGAHAAMQLRYARASLAWPTTRCEIIESKLTRYSGFRHQFDWEWIVRYRYRVDAQSYERTRVYFGWRVPQGTARALVARFPAHTTTGVAYHPDRHGKSVLLTGANKYTYYAFLAAPACWLLAFVLAYGRSVH